MATITLPERFKLVDATAGPVTTNGGVTGKYISAKTAQMVTLVLQFTQAVGHATVVTLKEATAVAGTGVQTMAQSSVIWMDADTATTDALTRQTDGTGVTLAADVKKKVVVCQINPASLSDGFDCLGFTVSDSSQATNFVSGVWLLEDRFAQATPPSAIVD